MIPTIAAVIKFPMHTPKAMRMIVSGFAAAVVSVVMSLLLLAL
jgi:hypothetical protein